MYKVWIRFCPSQLKWKSCTVRHMGNNRGQVSCQLKILLVTVLSLELRTTEFLQGTSSQRKVEVAFLRHVHTMVCTRASV